MRRTLPLVLVVVLFSRPALATIDMTGARVLSGSVIFGSSTYGIRVQTGPR